jgi:hypothetical protein
MSLSTCPIATIDAPIERVGRLLVEPVRYDEWWDAQTVSIRPNGPAQPAIKSLPGTVGLGMRWDVRTCASIDDGHMRVSFG